MNRLLFIVLLLSLLTVSCRRQASSTQKDVNTQIAFIGDNSYYFGDFRKPDTLVHYFVYKNIGKVPFVIQKVVPSCHCARPIYHKDPLPPGDTDSIGIVYDGNGYLPGYFVKTCDIYANTDSVYTLKIHGQCVEKVSDD